MLDELERQHVRENTLIDALSTALARHEHGDAGAAAAFTCAIQHLSGAVWEHMSLEETVILPAARRHLTTPTGQWSIKPFPRTKPPLRSHSSEIPMRQLFARIATALQ